MTAVLQPQQLSPLHAAAHRLDVQAVKELLQSGSNANEAAGSSGITPCMLACLPAGAALGQDPGVWLQLAAEAEEPYDHSTMEERLAVVRSLLAAGADPCIGLQQARHKTPSSSNSSSGSSNSQGAREHSRQQPMALQLVAAAGSTQLLEVLIAAAACAADVDKPCASGSQGTGSGQQQLSVCDDTSQPEGKQGAVTASSTQQQAPGKEDQTLSTAGINLLSATPASLALMAERPEALQLLLQSTWGSLDDPHLQGLPLHRAAQVRYSLLHHMNFGCVQLRLVVWLPGSSCCVSHDTVPFGSQYQAPAIRVHHMR